MVYDRFHETNQNQNEASNKNLASDVTNISDHTDDIRFRNDPVCLFVLFQLSQGLYPRLTRANREVSKLRGSGLNDTNCSEIWQASRQQRCRYACEIPER